jgi:hypothetical protein
MMLQTTQQQRKPQEIPKQTAGKRQVALKEDDLGGMNGNTRATPIMCRL